jgi:hypothetical protein
MQCWKPLICMNSPLGSANTGPSQLFVMLIVYILIICDWFNVYVRTDPPSLTCQVWMPYYSEF